MTSLTSNTLHELIQKRAQKINSLPSLTETINAHHLKAKKSLGQNFLLDQNITDKIARLALSDYPNPHDLNVIEIGPGPGGLTRSLLKAGVKTLSVVEFDDRAIKVLHPLQIASDNALKITHGDALQTDLTSLCEPPRAIVANLPYNIAAPLLISWLKHLRDHKDTFLSMTLMFQKEVAQRICAKPSTKSYGRLSVMCEWLCQAHSVYELPPSAFTPPPKVNSSVVHFRPRALKDGAPSFKAMEKVTTMAFGQRRKMIRSSLKPYKEYFETLKIDGTKRAEDLSVSDFVALASAQF